MSTTSSDYTKLTIPQLKVLCKERRIVGYSKLNKPALLEKLREQDVGPSRALSSGLPQPTPPSATASQSAASTASKITSDTKKRPAPNDASNEQAKKKKSKADQKESSSTTTAENATEESSNPTNKHPASTLAPQKQQSDLVTQIAQGLSSPNELLQDSISGSVFHSSIHTPVGKAANNNQALNKDSTSRSMLTPASGLGPSVPTLPLSSGTTLVTLVPPKPPTSRPTTGNTSGSRGDGILGLKSTTVSFKAPLLPSRINNITSVSGALPTAKPAQRFKPLAIMQRQTPQQQVAEEEQSDHLSFLNLPAFDLSSLKTVTMPPPLARRNDARNFALFLCRVDVKDLKNCALVSRHFRYAVYGSALTRLHLYYPIDPFMEYCKQRKLDPTRLNLWPYLSFLKQGVYKRKQTFLHSSLGRLFIVAYGAGDCTTLISNKIWASQHGRVLMVAFRFLLTRLFFAISIGNSDDIALFNRCQLVTMEERVRGLVWSVHVAYNGRTMEFYALEPTGEIISSQAPGCLSVRSDWATFVAQNKGLETADLLRHLHWTNHEEYLHGMSKVWLARTKEGDVEKRAVAFKYILASVSANSYSGVYMSHADMASEFAGNLMQIPPARIPGNRVNLFLPGHHHIEGIYFLTRDKKALHASLAVVQTPSREYFILRENGMHVGVEEDGVAPVWQRLLGCNASGCDVMPPLDI